VSSRYYIAKTVRANEYVVLVGTLVVAGPFASAAEAIKAREKLQADSG
jgi:hypothetical protein